MFRRRSYDSVINRRNKITRHAGQLSCCEPGSAELCGSTDAESAADRYPFRCGTGRFHRMPRPARRIVMSAVTGIQRQPSGRPCWPLYRAVRAAQRALAAPAQRRRLRRPVHAGRQSGQMASGPYQLVFRDHDSGRPARTTGLSIRASPICSIPITRRWDRAIPVRAGAC